MNRNLCGWCCCAAVVFLAAGAMSPRRVAAQFGDESYATDSPAPKLQDPWDGYLTALSPPAARERVNVAQSKPAHAYPNSTLLRPNPAASATSILAPNGGRQGKSTYYSPPDRPESDSYPGEMKFDPSIMDGDEYSPYAGCCDGENCNTGQCSSCWPRWYVQSEAIFLWRNNRAVPGAIAFSEGTQTSVLNTRSADFDTGIGPRALIGLQMTPDSAWECQYFSALDMNGGAYVSSPGQLSAVGQLGLLPGWNLVDAMGADYTSELHNVEINYVRSWGRFSMLGGFRFVRLTEDFDFSAFDGGMTSAYDVHSENNLFGAQLGGRWRECCGQMFWEFSGKAGVFGNDANQSQYLTDASSSSPLRDFTSYEGTVALVADMNLSIGFRMTRVWAARCGYNVMWVDQVALAADQLDFNTIPLSGRDISTDGNVFLHGINVGLEGRW